MHMRVAILATTCVTAACYNYLPITTPAPQPGTYLAVTLSDVGSDSLTRYLGPSVVVVRGRYLGSDDRALVVSVASVELRQGLQTSWSGESVSIPTRFVASLEMRRLAKGRSVFLAAAGVVGVAAIGAAVSLTARGSGSIYAPPGPPTSK
jgi:hypothetical protein